MKADTGHDAAEVAGPMIEGWYADPALVAFDGRFWLFPTTDGTPGWASTSFRAFSSPDLVSWTDHGEVFSVADETSWATGHAWAPAVVEQAGRFYLYFTADNNIGVAVGPSPLGPFTDLGRPLIAEGQFSGIAIDPSVFIDADGSRYLYWGNSVPHGVRLDPDMCSFEAEQVVTWDLPGFREALWVHRRADRYYMSWSENDTREADYRVRYATSDGPLGPWTEQGILLEKSEARGVLGPGHHSVLRIPGTDEWVIAYHRFAIPDGDGHHREVAVDRLHHRPDGLLEPVRPGAGVARIVRAP